MFPYPTNQGVEEPQWRHEYSLNWHEGQ